MSEALALGTNDPARAPSEGTVVECRLKGGNRIAVGRCVEYQRDNGCHCEHALVALRHVEKRLGEPVGVPAGYDRMTAKAIQEQQQQQQQQQQQLQEVRQLIARAEEIEKQRPATPAEEEPVAKRSYEKGRTCSGEGCANPVIDDSKTGKCTPCMQGLKPGSAAHAARSGKRAATANGNGHAEPKAPKPRAARKPRQAEPKATPSAPAIPDDIVGMLQRQRDHYQAQVARIDRAIAALAD